MDPDSIAEAALHSGPTRAVVSASGAAVRELTCNGKPLLRGFSGGQHPPETTNVVLAPWPNRVAGGRYTFQGHSRHLAVTEPARGHALHGFTPGRLFELSAEPDHTAVTARTWLGPEIGWPWRLALAVRYRLDDRGLTAKARLRNDSDTPAPAALGVHTYLSAQGAQLDRCTLHTELEAHQPLDSVLIPFGPEEPVDWTEKPMAGVDLDDCFRWGAAGRHRARLVDETGRGVVLDADARLRWAQLYTSQHPSRFLAFEPMTAPPNALHSGTDLSVLAPGDCLTVTWGVHAVGPDDAARPDDAAGADDAVGADGAAGPTPGAARETAPTSGRRPAGLDN